MMREREFDDVVRSWLESVSSPEPDGLLDSVVKATASTRPRPAWWVRLTGDPMPDRSLGLSRMAPLALATTVLVMGIAIGISLLVGLPNVGPPPVQSPTQPPPSQAADASGTWTVTGSLIEGRWGATATLLRDGSVLVAGGSETRLSERYDPRSGAWTASGEMTEARDGHSATLLPNGRVLVAGGVRPGADENGDGGNIPLASAELYDPATESWISAGNMLHQHGRGHTATLLPTGTVLVAGGGVTGGSSAAELYDPVTGVWTTIESMLAARWYHTATLLPDGRVLVAGSSAGPTAELYEPSTDTWTATAPMKRFRLNFTATLLLDGTVLVTADEGSDGAELYDPDTGTWNETAPMSSVRLGDYTATLLPDGSVLVVGGMPNQHDRAELYDPGSGSWRLTTNLNESRHFHTATLLPDGRVLVAGGRGDGTSAELYDPVPRASQP